MKPEQPTEELVVPYVRGELGPLEARWFESRLSVEQQTRFKQLAFAIDAVRNSDGSLSPSERARLTHRLDSVLPRRSIGPFWLLGSILVLGVVVFTSIRWVQVSTAPRATARLVPGLEEASATDGMQFVDGEIPELQFTMSSRTEITKHLRAILSERWVGRIDGSEKDTHVRIDQGLAAFGFDGGDGRRLEVTTVHGRVVVTGTRFSVAVGPDGAYSEVAVSEGEVEVWREREHIQIGAGQSVRISDRGLRVEQGSPPEILEDRYLLDVTKEPRLPHPPVRARSPGHDSPARLTGQAMGTAPVRGVDDDEAFERLDHADALALSGAFSRAVGAYETLMSDVQAGPVRQMARLGRARMLARMGQIRLARDELADLSLSGGEVGRQAKLSRCELRRPQTPCEALRCFEALSEDPDGQVALEARREAATFLRAEIECPKNSEAK